MRIFVAFEDVRLPMDVQPGQTVHDVKIVLREHFKLNSSHAEGKILRMLYAGAILRDEWVCSDIGISSGSTIKSALIDSDQPVLHVECPYNGETIVIRDQLNFATTSVSQLTRLVSSKSGFPVSVFRLCTKDGREMYNCHMLDRYGVDFGSVIKLHVWDGWAELLKAASQGHTRKVLRNASGDEQTAKFQLRVACYIAAHFGFVDLANSMLNPKSGAVKPEEPVGQHPAKLWSKLSAHADTWKSPVHEAVICGKVNVLRIFVQNNICCLVAKDGEGRTPMQVAFCHKQLECVQYLSSKLYSSHTENNITLPVLIVIKTRKWCETARDNVLANSGSYKSSMRRRPYKAPAMVGHGVLVDGYSDNQMNSKSKLEILSMPDPAFHQIPVFNDGSRLDHRRHKIRQRYDSHLGKTESALSHLKKRDVKYSESSEITDDAPRLPRISRRRNHVSYDTEESTPTEEDGVNTDSASYIQTPKPGQGGLPAIREGNARRTMRKKVLIEGSIPLPAVSVENHLRPFFHTSSRLENPVLVTLRLFENYRQMTSRENAIQCMTVASTFKDKAWLRQVDLAISLARRGVSNSLFDDTPHDGRTLPTVAASPIKTRE
uniref:protein ANKUB1-like n=1 Tax=Styela clava TaxID=7725 RepID=UPI001939C502|nr:protein ANKUB1-like [Styela clava]